jgi:hexosaminidase
MTRRGPRFLQASLLALTCASLAIADSETLQLMPTPAQVKTSDGRFRIGPDFTINISGAGGERLVAATRRTLRRLADRTAVFLPPTAFATLSGRAGAALQIRCQRLGQLALGEDEGYTLRVTPERVSLTATTDLGVMLGLETVLQLVAADAEGFYVPAVEIVDAPRFPWRGLLIDVSRHFMPVEMLKRNLDGMAAVKLNVMHWHLTDDQGFRVESRVHPRLHRMGSDGFYYTQEQIREVVAHAAARGIRVIPEFDLPGHATSWLVAHPELASAPGPYQIERTWGVFDPTLDPTSSATYRFLDSFFHEMATLFPDPYVHIGGDENNGKQWASNPRIQRFMRQHGLANAEALQRHFNQRMLTILRRNGKTMIGWDEIFQPGLPNNIVIQSWRGAEGLAKAARAGYQAILSNGYYIDLIHSTEEHYRNDPLPADTTLTATERKRVLGGEATMWAEFVTPETVDSRIWPRTAAIAERFWSPATVADVDDMYRRLDVVSQRLEEVGLGHEKNYGMLLRRLANGADTSALATLIDVLEPVKGYRRGDLRAHTSLSPLTRAVDAARPDQRTVRQFRKLVQRFLAGGPTDPVESWLELWRANESLLAPVFKVAPALREMESMSADLAAVAEIGLEAVAAISRGKTMSAEKADEHFETLKAARTPRGEAELMIIADVATLVCRAAREGEDCVANVMKESKSEATH